MHAKSCSHDGTVCVGVSYNFTNTAKENNEERLILAKDKV